MNIQIVIFDGVEEMDVIGVFEALRMADLDVALVSLRKQEIVTAFFGLKIAPEAVLDPMNQPDLLIVPGGGWLKRSTSGAWGEAERGDILQALKTLHANGVILASVCTGSMLLARAGLLLGRPATTNRGAIEELRAAGAKVVPARVIDDGDLITSGGITASLDLGLWLIERFVSVELAIEVSNRLEFEIRGPVWKRTGH
jgi:transcriptional regulator GlxA family with amidase domain